MSLFFIPTQTSFEQVHPSRGCRFFHDFQSPQTSSYSQYPEFLDAVRRGNSHSSLSYTQAVASLHYQQEIEAQQRQAAIARARREELERRYVQQLRLAQAQAEAQRQQELEAQRRHRQRKEQEIQLYQQFIQRRVAAQEEHLRRLQIQKAQLEKRKREETQRQQQQQQQREHFELESAQNPLLLALEELFGEALFGSTQTAGEDTQTVGEGTPSASKGKEPVRDEVEVPSSPAPQSPRAAAPEKAESTQSTQPEPSTSTSTSASISTSQPTRQLVFTHPFPSQENSSSIPTDQIEVSVDEKSGKVEVSGLWETQQEPQSQPSSESRPASPTLSHYSSTSSNKRKPHVSDVDEDGNEVESDDWDMAVDVVEDEKKVPTATSSKNISRTFNLPDGFKAEDLKAEIHDDGFKIYAESK